eukprot:649529-Prorocentrum_minimum.AAC.2
MTRVTVREESRDRYAARSSGFTEVPVSHGRAAVVTMYMCRPGSRRSLDSVFLSGAIRLIACFGKCFLCHAKAATGPLNSATMRRSCSAPADRMGAANCFRFGCITSSVGFCRFSLLISLSMIPCDLLTLVSAGSSS